jgi:hypothetical protein
MSSAALPWISLVSLTVNKMHETKWYNTYKPITALQVRRLLAGFSSRRKSYISESFIFFGRLSVTQTDFFPSIRAFPASYQFITAFLDAFAKLGKATLRFVIYVCPPVTPHGTPRFPLDVFLLNFIFEDILKIH